jgi:hypothetical protein
MQEMVGNWVKFFLLILDRKLFHIEGLKLMVIGVEQLGM